MKNYILEKRGIFWWHDDQIPDNCYAPSQNISGVLKIDEEGGIKLELDGALPEKKDIPLSNLCIQGTFKDDYKYTLLSGLEKETGFKWSRRGFDYKSYYITHCLIQNHFFPSVKEPLFNCMKIDLNGLEEWFRIGSIKINYNHPTISVAYEKPSNIEYLLDDGKISIQYNMHSSKFPINHKEQVYQISLQESVSLIYTLNNPISLNDVKSEYNLFSDLFILLTNSNYSFNWPLILFNEGKIECKFYFPRQISSATYPKWFECPTNFVMLKDTFGTIFSTWKKNRNLFGPAFYLYLATRRDIFMYIEPKYASLIWGLEAFDRHKNSDTDNGCNCILMLDEMPLSGSQKIDGNTIYLIKNKNGEFIAHWKEKGSIIPHKLKNTLELNNFFMLEKKVDRGNPEFDTITTLCGYSHITIKINKILTDLKKSDLSNSDKRWLKGKLKHAHEPPLSERIFRTLKKLPFFLKEEGLKNFSDDCAKQRNAISHFGASQEHKYNEFTQKLNDSNVILSFFYHALLLQEIGIDEKILIRWLENGFSSSGIKSNLIRSNLIEKDLMKNDSSLLT